MFDKIKSINFENLKSLDFAFSKRKKEFEEYFILMEKIYNYYLEFEKYIDILNDNDKNILKKDIQDFSNILLNIQNKIWEKPDNRLKKDKFSNNYINWLKQTTSRYQHFYSILNWIKIDNEKNIEEIKNQNDIFIKECNKEKDELDEKYKTQIESKEVEINTIVSEKWFLETEVNNKNTEIENLKLEIQKKELNKLAEAFDKEEIKYTEWSKKWIIFWFFLLSIPALFSIYIVLSEFIDNQYFNYLTISSFKYEIIPFIILTLILWYFQYFQLKNYYINRDLATNFSNRKAIANSFKWLLELVNEEWNSLGDNKTELITKFIDKVWDVLYSNIDTSYMKKHNEDVPVSKLLDTVNELIKKIK